MRGRLVLLALLVPLIGLHSHASAQLPPPLVLRMSTDAPTYPVGAPVTLMLRVTNPTDTSVSLVFPTSQHYDFTVAVQATGAVVWRWSAGRVFAAGLSRLVVRPGETVSFAAQWDQQDLAGWPVAPGVYVAAGSLTAQPPQVSDVQFFLVSTAVSGAAGGEALALVAGCNAVALTWPNGTLPGEIAAALTPPTALVAIWRWSNRTRTFQAFAPQAPEASDLAATNRFDVVYICLQAGAALLRPVLAPGVVPSPFPTPTSP